MKYGKEKLFHTLLIPVAEFFLLRIAQRLLTSTFFPTAKLNDSL